MVPYQPRQLVIFSLPFAALVAFFWFRRRRSSSLSDPGGTLAQPKRVDTSQQEPSVTRSEGEAVEVEKRERAAAVTDADICRQVEEVICNGTAVHVKEDTEVEKTSSEVAVIDTAPKADTAIFHSTIIEDEKDFEVITLNLTAETYKTTDDSVVTSQISKLESENVVDTVKVEETPLVDTKVEEIILEKTVVEETKLPSFEVDAKIPEVIETEKEFFGKTEIIEALDNSQENTTPLEDQSTVENLCLKKAIVEDSCSTDLSEDTVPAESDVTDKDTSTDTGVGSQDESQTSSMAQGQKTEHDGSGLEHKLASLGLDTQQPARDSANHSPAEVMLNSPAISTFSDAHSEGSSDSGKGCSDVVTPPSRTPAGGSSVAGDHDHAPSSYEFVLPQVIVGRLIGRHGAFLHDIRAKTHTNVFIKRHPETNTLKICAIEGAQNDIDAALKMIRQKFPLRRFPELTLERVSFVKNSPLPISPENLQLHLVEGVNNDVIVSSLISAGHMFLQLPMHLSYQSLYRLACIMNTVYSTQDSPPLPDPHPDAVCVAPAHGGWYRAQILAVDEDNNTSDIRFLDYGGFVTIDNALLRQIRGDFLLLPFQAVECALANVLPAGGEEEWSEEAKQFVHLITTQQTLQAQVYEYTETGMPLVYLYCTQFYQSTTDPSGFETKVVLLNEELVSRGYAELIDQVATPTDGSS